MGMKVVFSCDGCSRQIQQADVEKTNALFLTWNSEPGARQNNPEIFCERCRERAVEFWLSKVQMMDQCLREMRGRMEKHKNKFWTMPKPTNLVVMK